MKTMILILALCVSFTVHAQWSTNPAINTSISDTVGAASRLSPKSVSDGNGGAIIVWSNTKIYGQRVNSAGQKLWGIGGIWVGLSSDPVFLSSLVNPVVVSDDSGGAIIAWAEFNARRMIGAARITRDSSKVWDQRVCFSTTGTRTNPAIASDGAGGAFITWEDSRNGSNNIDIFAQHMSASGSRLWDSNGVAVCTAIQNQTVPRIASDGTGGAFITWADNRILDSDIYAQRVGVNGDVQWGTNGMRVCVMSNNPAGNPRIVANGVGTAIIAWVDGRSAGTWDMYAQGVNLDTTAWTTNGVPIATATRNQWKAEMIADGSGGAIIAWQDNRRISFDEADVYAQRIASNGGVLWVPNGIPVCTQQGNANPLLNITSDGDGGAYIVWEDQRNGNTDIYAQHVNSGGGTTWNQNGVAISTAPSTQASVTLASRGGGGAIFAWHDARRGPLDIYGQGVDSIGALAGTTSVGEETIAETFRLEQNYPNPFNPSTLIPFSVQVSGFTSLRVYDVLGREVAALVNENLNAGSYETTFDATGLASGVYIYRLTSGNRSLSRKLLLTR